MVASRVIEELVLSVFVKPKRPSVPKFPNDGAESVLANTSAEYRTDLSLYADNQKDYTKKGTVGGE